MKPFLRTMLVCLALLGLLSSGLAYAGAPQRQGTTPTGHPAQYAVGPVGPDFQVSGLLPLPVYAPPRAAVEATLEQNRRYQNPAEIPENVQVSYSGDVPGASHPVNDFSECMVYLDPTNPSHLLGSSKFFYVPASYDFYTGVFESYDAGHTWTELQPDGIENYSLTSDPVTTFDDQGNGYFTLLTRGPTGLDMLKKPAGGAWQLPVVVDRTTSTDKQWIMGDQNPQGISPYAGNLYMSWTSFGGPVTGIVFSRSIDGNQSWSAPIALTGGDIQGSVPGVAPDGTVYVVYGRGIFYGPTPGTMEFVKSTNGGVSFGSPSVAANITAIPYSLPDPFGNWQNFRSPASLPGFAVSPTNGNLYIVWADYRNNDSDIYFTRSTNGGASWDSPVRLNDDPIGNGIDQWQPQVNVAPNGRVAVMWFDRRLPCPDLPWIPLAHRGVLNGCIDTFMARSFDDGATWSPNIRASAQTWDWTLNLPSDGSNGFIGDYQGIASSNSADYPFWNATANLGQNAENYQEIFVAIASVGPDLSGATKTVDRPIILPGDAITYTVVIPNRGLDAPGAQMTDTLPVSTSMITGTLWASSGQAGYDMNTNTITWTGGISTNAVVTVSFGVIVAHSYGDGSVVRNVAVIDDNVGTVVTRTADVTVSLPPYLVATSPAAASFDVPIDEPVVITFSEGMNPASLVFSLLPDPGAWSTQWSPDQQVVTLTHAPFDYVTTYLATVTARDEEGDALAPSSVPNPWAFSTALPDPPVILQTGPADGAVDVALVTPVVITFSFPMSTASLNVAVQPDPGGWSVAWSAGDTVATLSHNPLAYGTTYTVTVEGENSYGQALVPGPVPNPWSFSTLPPTPPYVVQTWPANGATEVALNATITVQFSEAISTTTLSLTVTPDPGGWSQAWGNGNTILMLAHAPFTLNTTYTVTVWAQDLQGEEMAAGPVPNPWSFHTVTPPPPEPTPPEIVATWPADGAVDVPVTTTVVITFSEVMNPVSFTLTAVPDLSGWSVTWMYSDTVAVLTPAPLAYSTTYTLTVSALDAEGEALVAGPAPNPWSFMTAAEPVQVFKVYLPVVLKNNGR